MPRTKAIFWNYMKLLYLAYGKEFNVMLAKDLLETTERSVRTMLSKAVKEGHILIKGSKGNRIYVFDDKIANRFYKELAKLRLLNQVMVKGKAKVSIKEDDLDIIEDLVRSGVKIEELSDIGNTLLRTKGARLTKRDFELLKESDRQKFRLVYDREGNQYYVLSLSELTLKRG